MHLHESESSPYYGGGEEEEEEDEAAECNNLRLTTQQYN